MSATATRGLHYPFGASAFLDPAGPPPPSTSKRHVDPGRLDRPVATVRGIGRTTERRLRSLGIRTVGDLLLHLPFRHEPPSRVADVGALCVGEEVILRVHVVECALRETVRRRVKVLEALVCDDTGSVVATWYNQAYLEAAFRERPEVLLKGVLVRQKGVTTFLVKRHEILSDGGESHHILGLVPVYPSTADLSVRTIRTVLHQAAAEAGHLIDPLPSSLLACRHYPGKGEAVLTCHFPATLKEAAAARERLAFEELLLLQIAVLRQRQAQQMGRRARALRPAGGLTAQFLAALPYAPTSAQLKVIGEIEADLLQTVPMRRLLHGDVGSGKTMVAAYCLLRAVEQGAQGALMAPTEVLADQHFLGLSEQLRPLGVRVGLLKGGQTAGERRTVRESLEAGEIDVVVGTHALIQQGVRFRDLRVAVVDEQHRFGVRQRDAILVADDGEALWPHTLHMSATPIPRTLSLTLYGDLDVSVLDEMPSGRRPVRTRLVFGGSEARMWRFVRAELERGRQAYVVCPLIEESESLETASARRTFEELAAGELAGFRLRLLHGQLPPAEKAAAMADYASGRADVLVSTSVIEVGVDVANATVMVIMGARRFGLSQLHQLRGRVGRGVEDSYCFLLAEGEDEAVLERLALFARTTDGFELAEADLLSRGEGQLFGERQSGVGDLEVASLFRDRALLEEARAEAARLLREAAEGRAPASTRLVMEAAEARFGEKIRWMERV
ncbi:MAG: ATP-dependent DNA helicase RecG [Actinomycetia bacterium]|nr:ATP-dependent DNA helicase RecG [Actinomycetes bacterium]